MSNFLDQELLKIKSADVVSDAEGRQYHIQLAPGDLAEYIILVGDPGRVERAQDLLTDIRFSQQHREYASVTGQYKGVDVSILSTGIGSGSMEIALIELYQITHQPALIRVGTCGALQENIQLGDLIISSGAVRLEKTSAYFVHEGYPAVASYEAISALVMACDANHFKYHVGVTATAPGFYGAQGRDIPGLHLRYPNLQEEMAEMNVLNFEMETSALLTLSTLLGLRASTICLAIAQREQGAFIEPEVRRVGERSAMIAGLDALVNLHQMDEKKDQSGKKHWVPDL